MRRPAHAQTAAIDDLRPTQITVGYREVVRKRRRWREQSQLGGARSASREIPVLRGPEGQLFIVDHHHLARALSEEGVATVALNLVADLSVLTAGKFWEVCEERGWCHPYDAVGVRRDIDAIPRTVGALADDPFRSLAGELRRAGGFAKQPAPFSEFVWADFLRCRIERATVGEDFDRALRSAFVLSRSPDAENLPGWRPERRPAYGQRSVRDGSVLPPRSRPGS